MGVHYMANLIPAVVIFGEAEHAAREIIWRDLAARTERRHTLDALPQPEQRPALQGGSAR